MKTYLTEKGYSNLYLDELPDAASQPEAINLNKWDHTVDPSDDGCGTHVLRIHVRRSTYDLAYSVCRELFQLLDSGAQETPIALTEEQFCIARPRKGPIFLERGEGYVVFICEIALWGEN